MSASSPNSTPKGRDKIRLLNSDVITLDVEMPMVGGPPFLRNPMRLPPMPALMCPSLTEHCAASCQGAAASSLISHGR